MKRTVIIYGLALAVLVFLLKYMEYRLIVRDLSIEFYSRLLIPSRLNSGSSWQFIREPCMIGF